MNLSIKDKDMKDVSTDHDNRDPCKCKCKCKLKSLAQSVVRSCYSATRSLLAWAHASSNYLVNHQLQSVIDNTIPTLSPQSR